MAHSLLHFAIGITIGTAVSTPLIILKLRFYDPRDPMNRIAVYILKWIIITFGIGLFAIIPNLLRRLGCPEFICGNSWMNFFLFHHFIDQIKKGGMLIGQILIFACFILQYMLIIIALTMARFGK